MDDSARRKISDYVRPLAVGLDGVTNYGDVRRMITAAEALAEGRDDVDRDLLFLLACFSGQERWVSRMGHRSRTEIFLASLDLPARTIRRLFRGLARFASAPASPEEEIVHDTVRLEAMGAYGIARGLVEGYRERMDIREMAEAIEAAAAAELKTERGRAVAAARAEFMREFARRLRAEHDELAAE